MNKWCLNIKLHFSGTYVASGFVSLPSSCTVRDHSKSGAGFLPDVTEQLIKETKLSSLKLHEKHAALCFDEI